MLVASPPTKTVTPWTDCGSEPPLRSPGVMAYSSQERFVPYTVAMVFGASGPGTCVAALTMLAAL